MRTTCRDMEPVIQDYLDGSILAGQREELEFHLSGCGSCRSLLSGLRRVDGWMEGLREVEVPAELSRAILSLLPPRASAPVRERWAPAFAFAPVFAVLVVVLGFLFTGRSLINELKGARPVEVVFVDPSATSLAVVGDFNGWNPRANRMVRVTHEGIWRTTLKLQPGTYQYGFVVDGDTWAKDPGAVRHLADGFGGENSVIIVDG